MKKYLLTIGLILTLSIFVEGQNISGIINTYTPVTGIGASSVTVFSTVGFGVGGKVLIIEMQGATVNGTNTSSFGNITSYGNAGNYEFDTITAIAGNVISFKNNLTTTFDTAGKVQLVTVPVYSNATVTGTLTCQPWNDSTGGILVFQVTCTLTMNANIDVSNLGFIGGNFESDGGNFSCTAADYYTSSLPAWGDGGQKGESISRYIFNEDGSMGNQANGGGGGNPGNSGGGGGGNFGAGGTGGYEYNGCGSNTIFGYPGQALSNAGNKIFMGGGGGGGLADNGQAVTAGGNGGAIAYVMANILTGNSEAIVDTGESVTQYSSDESSGGGGAGGSVILNVNNYTSPITVNTRGGYGGSSFNHIFTTGCHGPGGGGGGGLLWTNGAVSPSITYLAKGGATGLVLNPASACYNTSFGASAGDTGGVLTSLASILKANKLNLGDDTSLCFGKSVILHAGSEFMSYLWQDNTTDSILLAANTGKYYVTVTDSNGCKESDTVKINVENQIKFSLGNDTSLCLWRSLTLHSPQGFVSYLWQDNTTDSTYTVSSEGKYLVKVTDSIGCKASDSIVVNVYPKDSLDLGNNNSICSGKPIPLNAGNGFKSYLWQDGSTNQTDSAKIGGLYTVITTDNVGCNDTASTLVKVVEAPIVNLGRDTSLCMPFSKLLLAGSGFVSYVWVDSATNVPTTTSTYLVTMPGKYSVTIIDTNNCTVSDSIIITNGCPEIFLPNAFSPGGAGANAIFRGFGENITSYNMHIFNRWGQLLFESNDINYGWDGRFNGKPEPIGVYVYEVQYTGEDRISHLTKGNITLLR